jgi:hypothetical protein
MTGRPAIATEPYSSALPPPLSPEELLARADLAGRARIVSVVRSLDATSPHTGLLKFEKLLKGTPRYARPILAKIGLDRTVVVKIRRLKRDRKGVPLPGEWFDGYRAGDRVMTHLVWDVDLLAYRTLWWNAVWQTPRD